MQGYPLHQCGLYAIKSRRQLAARLNRTLNFLLERADKPSIYRVWQESKSSGGYRTIEAPRDDLKAIQKRIADLLQRVLAPSFLFSPVKGLSYVENALAHRGACEVRLLDVTNYFGNCTSTSVFKFFSERLKCAPDVAWILTGLTTRMGHLPQGSPCSPILSFYCCQPMWDRINNAVRDAGCVLTVYVDDITISGPVVKEELIWRVKQILHGFGHSHHKKKERRHFERAAEITGIMVGPDRLSVPHRHYKKLLAARMEARLAADESTRIARLARARSLESQVQRLGVLLRNELETRT